jgi:hypothetical protein
MQHHVDAVRRTKPVERHLEPLGIEQHDPVAGGLRVIGFGLDAERAQRFQHLLAGARHRLPGRAALLEEPAIGKHLRIGRRAAQKAVFLHQAHFRARLGGTERGADAARATAHNDHVIICFGTPGHDRMLLRVAFARKDPFPRRQPARNVPA